MTTTDSWPPRTEVQLEQALTGKLLKESHYLDIKQELSASESANREFAKDLASFSVDGGTIIIGVAEGPPPSLHAVKLVGLRERIEAIGLTRVDEPVQVTTYEIPSAADQELGYVVVEVPVSGRAPHMVDGRYYERGDSKNKVLSDPEVMRWHERKIREQQDLTTQARDELELLRNGSPSPLFNLLIIANPMGARRPFLMALSTSTSWKVDIAELMFSASKGCNQQSSLRQPTQIDRHADGIIAITDLTQPTEAPGYNRAEVIFDETSGRLTLLSGGLIRYVPGSGAPAIRGVAESKLLAHTEFIVHLAAEVSKYGFKGSWQFALAANMLGQARSYTLSVNPQFDGPSPAYQRFDYARSYTSASTQVAASPHTVVRELVAPLLRSLGSEGQFPWLFS